MRDALKTIFSQEIITDNNSLYYYGIQPYELTNALGHSKAILQEYIFTKKRGDGEVVARLYKTKEGNWYDIEEAKEQAEKEMVRMLKSAIDSKENKTVLE